MNISATQSNSSIEVDSGIHRLSIKPSTTQSSLTSIQMPERQKTSQPDGDDAESADSFETAIAGSAHQPRSNSSQSDLSDSFLDAAEVATKKSVKRTEKEKSRAREKQEVCEI